MMDGVLSPSTRKENVRSTNELAVDVDEPTRIANQHLKDILTSCPKSMHVCIHEHMRIHLTSHTAVPFHIQPANRPCPPGAVHLAAAVAHGSLSGWPTDPRAHFGARPERHDPGSN